MTVFPARTCCQEFTALLSHRGGVEAKEVRSEGAADSAWSSVGCSGQLVKIPRNSILSQGPYGLRCLQRCGLGSGKGIRSEGGPAQPLCGKGTNSP